MQNKMTFFELKKYIIKYQSFMSNYERLQDCKAKKKTAKNKTNNFLLKKHNFTFFWILKRTIGIYKVYSSKYASKIIVSGTNTMQKEKIVISIRRGYANQQFGPTNT